ncbi:MAG: hypothetical protein ACHQIM_15975 [Sphingobacteriales bacterium]
MKNLLLLFTFLFLCTGAYCQSKNTVSVIFGTGSNGVGLIGIGGPGYQGQGESIFGFNYSWSLTRSFSIETGLEYSVNNVLLDYVDPPRPNFTPQKASIRMLSVPVFANITFLKYFFADGGFIADFETSHKSDAIVSDQSGIGMGLGIGGKYNFKKVTLFINPFIQFHDAVSFNRQGGGSLFDQSVKFGIGYRF